ncbi:MAG: hypothetical protein HDR00_10115 [Lachnospiraceae bacterium]|nr:hypothetical protein [Lachnospiraceae bacterium]
MTRDKKPYYLVKFIDKKWADKLMDGEVFMRAIACFGDISRRSSDSQNEFRGDVLEGTNYSFGNQVGLIDVLTYREKIYCLYALEFDEETGEFIKPDNRILEFGDTAVIIHNTGEFLRRICYAMLERFGNDLWTSFQRVEYDVDFSVEQPYDEFCKALSYAYQNEFRIALDLAKGKFNPEQLKDVTDFARLTFPGKIEEDTNPDSLSDSLTLNIGNIRDISISIPTSELLDDDFKFPPGLTIPQIIPPMRMPREPMPTFFRFAIKLP